MTTADTEVSSRGEHRTIVQDNEHTSDALVRAVAVVEGCDPLDLTPLYDSIDPDTIDALFDPTSGRVENERTLTLAYHGHEVTVSGDSHHTRIVVDDR
jgi:hypothetical protein